MALMEKERMKQIVKLIVCIFSLFDRVVDDTPASGTATLTVTVTDVNEAPAFDKTIYATTIADGSIAGKLKCNMCTLISSSIKI